MVGLKAPSKDEHGDFFFSPTAEHVHCSFSSSIWDQRLEAVFIGTDTLSLLADEACFTLEELRVCRDER